MVAVNQGFAASYEQDPWSQELKQKILSEFDAVDSALVFNGTAANVLCTQLALQSYEALLCSDASHLAVDECGAPEKIAGVKLVSLPTDNGKIRIPSIEQHITRRGDQHCSQVKMLSITQPTEYGTLYSLEEIAQIAEICKSNDLYLHMDGARLGNAAAALQCNFKTLVKHCDLVSFGGAKNGSMLGEFVIVRNPDLKKGLKFFRKQSLQLPAKTRFLSAPMIRYLQDDLWLEIAQHENEMAQLLRQGLEKIGTVTFTRPTQANSVFCILPRPIIKELRKSFFFYVWDEQTFEVRLMTGFSVTPQHINDFVTLVQSIHTERTTP